MFFLPEKYFNSQLSDEITQVLANIPNNNTEVVALATIMDSPILQQLRTTEGSALQELSEYIQQTLSNGDYLTRIDLNKLADLPFHVTNIATLFACLAGEPFLLYSHEPYWESLGVKLDVLGQSMHGILRNSFHVDLMTNENPPDVIAFLGKRPDPLGGGFSELSNVYTALNQLAPSERELLQRPIYRYWLDNPPPTHVGKPLTRFAIDDQISKCVRFTAKAIQHFVAHGEKLENVLHPEAFGEVEEIRRVLDKFYTILEQGAIRFLVEKNHLVLFNQKILLHARTPLGEGQVDIPENERRWLLQGYVRLPATNRI